jgi:hypothetical protein
VPLRPSFVPLSRLSRRKAQHERVASLAGDVELLERALESVKIDVHTPASYGPAQRLRGSILEEELASTKAELEGLRTRLHIIEVQPLEADLNAELAALSAERAASPGSHSERGRMRARIVLSSLAAVAVLLGMAKLPVEHTSQAQAQGVLLGATSESLAPPWSDNLSSAPQTEVTLSAPAFHLSEDPAPTRSRVRLPAVDYFEGGVTSAPAVKAAPMLSETPVGMDAAEAIAAPGESHEFVVQAIVEPAPVTGSVITLAAVRVREQPATSARTLRSIAAGSRLARVGGSVPGWTQVRAPDGTAGWIISSALRPV